MHQLSSIRLTGSQIESVLREYLDSQSDVLFAYQFGSSAGSDVFADLDVGVYLQNGQRDAESFDRTMKMSVDLERLTGISTDVILINTAPDHLTHSITGGKLLVNRNDDERVRIITASWSRYFDIEVVRRQWLADVVGK